MAMVASPSNPTGTLVTHEEIAALAALAREKGGTLLVDEIYHGLTYGIDAHTAAEQGDDVFVVNSFSKYFQMTGWRLGWLVAPHRVSCARSRRSRRTSSSRPRRSRSTRRSRASRRRRSRSLEARRAELDERRRYLVPALESLGFRVPVVPQGAFYIYADCSRAHRRQLHARARASSPRRTWRSRRARTSAANEPERHIRIAYTQTVARLEEAVARIRRLLERGT